VRFPRGAFGYAEKVRSPRQEPCAVRSPQTEEGRYGPRVTDNGSPGFLCVSAVKRGSPPSPSPSPIEGKGRKLSVALHAGRPGVSDASSVASSWAHWRGAGRPVLSVRA